MLRDLRYAVHTLRRSPGYTVLAVVVLALGIGANAAIFSVLDSVVLHALPYPDPDRLVFVWQRFPALPPPIGPRMSVVPRNFKQWQAQASVFSAMAAFVSRPQTRRLPATRVTLMRASVAPPCSRCSASGPAWAACSPRRTSAPATTTLWSSPTPFLTASFSEIPQPSAVR
jgi:hypothetical protein